MTSFSSDKEKRLNTVLESVPSGIVVVDKKGDIVLLNSEAERMFGYEPDELIGKPVEVLVPPASREMHPGLREFFMKNPSKRKMGAGRDLSGIRKNGVEFPVEIGLNPVETENGFFVVASVVDITERKQFEETFRRSEEKFRIAIEAAPNGIIMVDTKGKIVLCNAEAEKMFGYAPGELEHQNIERLVPKRSQAIHPNLRQQFHEHPAKRQMGAGRDLAGLRKDGTEIPVEIGLNPVHSPSGDFVLASVLDITERKRHEQQLHDAYKEVKRRNLEMEQFVYTISHDLRSPLVTTMGFVEFIREDIEAGNFVEVNDALTRIERANKRMQQLIDDLLQLSRAGRLELKLEPIDLKRLLASIVDSISQVVEEKGAKIEIADTFPVIEADRGRLHQIFENLILNSLKYGMGNADPRIRIFCEMDDNEVRICVADNGKGIPQEYHRKIFGLFQRLDTSQEGTGVGLTIVSRIAELHGGRVWVESAPDQGAAFWVALPKKQKPQEEQEPWTPN